MMQKSRFKFKHKLSLLWSYAYIKANSLELIESIAPHVNVLIDSGAFTNYWGKLKAVADGKTHRDSVKLNDYIQVCREHFPGLPQWSRVLVSNFVSLPIDSLAFSLLAFVVLPPLFGADAMPFGAAIARVVGGQTLYKLVVAVVSMPLIYTVSEKPLIDEQV